MLTPLNRLTRIMVILGVAVWISGAPAFAQETQPATPPASTSSMPPPADPGPMQPAAASADTATTPPEASPAPATPDTPPSGPSASNGSPAPPPADTTAAQPAAAPTPAAPPSTPMDTKPAAATAESTLTQALAAYEQQDFAAAAEAFKHTIDSNPSSVEAHYYLGYALYKLKRFDESRVAFTQAYQLRSDYLPPVAQTKK